MAINLLPPSPAPSDCDSLAGIDDLEAFLAAQGPLSIFPTPDPQHDLMRNTQTCYDRLGAEHTSSRPFNDFECDPRQAQYHQAAIAFYDKMQQAQLTRDADLSAIIALFIRTELPVEILAIAYAILDDLSAREAQRSLIDCQADLLVIATLALADIHTNDHPLHLTTWSRLITSSQVAVSSIDRLMLSILETLDWTLHKLCDPIAVEAYVDVLTTREHHDLTRQTLPKLRTHDSSTALWVYGQLTPSEHSPSPVIRPGPAYFLPLL